MSRIMYVKPNCPWCAKARDALGAQGVEWEERDATADPAWREELMTHSKGTGVVPTIVTPDGVQVGWDGHG
jgi:glutaredoxin 3